LVSAHLTLSDSLVARLWLDAGASLFAIVSIEALGHTVRSLV
jgi:hypothetical protein